MESVSLSLTPRQMEKLAIGGAVMISPAMVGGAITCMMHPHKKQKMSANHAAGKKYRLTLDQEEMKGGSFKGFVRKLKKGALKAFEGYKKYVKPTVGPLIRKGLKEGIHGALEIGAATTGQPELVAFANTLANELEGLVDYIGDKTEAWGMKRPHPRRT